MNKIILLGLMLLAAVQTASAAANHTATLSASTTDIDFTVGTNVEFVCSSLLLNTSLTYNITNVTLYRGSTQVNQSTTILADNATYFNGTMAYHLPYGQATYTCAAWTNGTKGGGNGLPQRAVSSGIELNTSLSIAANQGTVNETADLVWSRNYAWQISCLMNKTTELRRTYINDLSSSIADYNFRFPVNYTYNLTSTLNSLAADKLYLCDAAQVNMTFQCEYNIIGNKSDAFNLTLYKEVNITSATAGCVNESSTVTKGNYTVNEMNDTYIDMTMAATGEGTLRYKWKPAAYNGTHGVGALRCSNAETQQKFYLPTAAATSFAYSDAIINVSGDSREIECAIDPTVKTTAPTNIPLHLIGASVLAVAVVVVAVKRLRTSK